MHDSYCVDRRIFLTLSTAVVALVGAREASAARAGNAAAGDAGATLSFDEFLALANPLAKRLVADASREGQDRYLLALAAVAVRLGAVAPPEMRETGPGKAIGANAGGDPFNVLHWRLDPGAAIDPHPHIYGNVVTLVLEGEARITNYEMLGERDWDARGTFRVRRTCDQFVGPGGTNLVSLERNYMHGFVAGPQGARGLDLTTRILPKRASPVLDLAKEPLDRERAIWEASWTS